MEAQLTGDDALGATMVRLDSEKTLRRTNLTMRTSNTSDTIVDTSGTVMKM